ncbi:hypothetical protein LCGC14_3097560 [marine sediment metagenome]|uniref:Uncharacterized protein n=1 Tax=marine sediment metagenome TaxID=412755 RepID=A0A0F8WXI5_9ZZZZ
MRGKVNYRNISRYCTYSEKAISRNFRKTFSFAEFNRKVIEVGKKKTLCISLPSIIVEAYKIKRKDIITLSIRIRTLDIEFTNKVYRTAKMLRITIPMATVNKNSIKSNTIYSFEFLKNHRDGVNK